MPDKNNTKNNVLVFLGAGAAAFSGYSTFLSFRNMMFDEKLRKAENLPPLHDNTLALLEEIEDELKNNLAKPVTHDNYMWVLNDYLNYCRIFEKFQGINTRFNDKWGDIGQFQNHIKNAISDVTRTTLCHYSINRISLDNSPIGIDKFSTTRVLNFYINLAKFNSQTQPYLPIFTTNYDVLFEDIFTNKETCPNGINLATGIPSCCVEGGMWDRAAYLSSMKKGFHLYRLHGCVCWYYPKYGIEDIYFHRSYTDVDKWEESACVMFPGREIYRGKIPHSFGFNTLFHSLLNCKLLIINGFSFRDDDVLQIFLTANGLRSKKNPIKMIVVNPTLTEHDIINCFKDALTRNIISARIPEFKDISSLKIKFGTEDFDSRILALVENQL